LLGSVGLYTQFGKGVSFFPSVEPEFMQVQLRARDLFSIWERDTFVREVEGRLLGNPSIEHIYARAAMGSGRSDEDIIGTLQLDLVDWDQRPTAATLTREIRADLADIAGIDIQVQTQNQGPGQGKPVTLQLRVRDAATQTQTVEQVLDLMQSLGGFTDVTDTRALPGVEVAIRVDREEAARFGADISLLGQAVQLLTRGIEVADYRPDDSDGPMDIRVRFPSDARTLTKLASLRVPTPQGLVPISNFVTIEPTNRVGTIRRVDERRVVTISANVADGALVSDRIEALRSALEGADLPQGMSYTFEGEAQDQQDAQRFLALAFGVSVFAMLVTLVMQFNSFYQAFVVMSAIVFSISGVLFGLMITGRPFGIVMSGIGIIALAGIVVNNNIILIDTYNDLKRAGQSPREAALRTGAQRLRPVVLTSVTTALGLMPMVIGLNIDFFNRTITYGAPSTQWWTELSSTIVGGLLVATVLTLVVTPAMLMLGEALQRKRAAPIAPDDGPLRNPSRG